MLKAAYVLYVRRIQSAAYGRPSTWLPPAEWSGGVVRAGAVVIRRLPDQWAKLEARVRALGADPFDYVGAVLGNRTGDRPFPPQPNRILGPDDEGAWRNLVARRVPALTGTLDSQLQRLAALAHSYTRRPAAFAPGRCGPADAVLAALAEPLTNFDPLFAYCAAVAAANAVPGDAAAIGRCRKAAAALRPSAETAYLDSPAAYDAAWGDFITPALKSLAARRAGR